jgi:RNA polymerase sigma factor (sigma-70 family)
MRIRSFNARRFERYRRASPSEDTFARLVDQYHASLSRVARLYIANRAVADEVVQDTWLGVIQGMWAFEGRSSLKTWIFRILINRAKTLAAREGRTVPFARFDAVSEAGEAAVFGAPPSWARYLQIVGNQTSLTMPASTRSANRLRAVTTTPTMVSMTIRRRIIEPSRQR